MKRARLVVTAALICTLLSGCGARSGGGGGFTPTENSIYVTRDGEISSALVQNYEKEKDYYNQDELKAFAEEAVIQYNREKGAGENAYNEADSTSRLPVALQSCTLSGGAATLVFDYASFGDLTGFAKAGNDLELTVTGLTVLQLADAFGSGALDGVEFVKPDGSPVSIEDVKKLDKAFEVTVEGSGTIQTEGKVQYMSKGVSLVNEHTVSVPEQGISYIIFK